MPTLEEINAMEEFAAKHGNHLHAKVATLLRENGWDVLVSPYYRDNATDKAREADIIAEREFPIMRFNQYEGSVRFRLIVECKYLLEDTLCWFDDKDARRAIELITSNTPLVSPNENVSINDHHWYRLGKVAKLFAAKPKNGDRTKETENEVLFSAFDKVLNSLIYYRGTNTIIAEKDLRKPLLYSKTITYPIVILNNFAKLYKTTMADPTVVETMETTTMFTAEINYAYVRFVAAGRFSNTEYFLADVVSFSDFPKYLEMIGGAELRAMMNLLPRASTLQ